MSFYIFPPSFEFFLRLTLGCLGTIDLKLLEEMEDKAKELVQNNTIPKESEFENKGASKVDLSKSVFTNQYSTFTTRVKVRIHYNIYCLGTCKYLYQPSPALRRRARHTIR